MHVPNFHLLLLLFLFLFLPSFMYSNKYLEATMKPFFYSLVLVMCSVFQISLVHSQCPEGICGDPMALNYDLLAENLCEFNCIYPECNDPMACNYGLFSSDELTLCYYPGCDNSNALNYDPDAIWTCVDNTTCLCDAPDVDCNGIVNTMDLLVFLGQLGCEGDDCPGDLDGDGIVSVMDLLIFLTVFP